MARRFLAVLVVAAILMGASALGETFVYRQGMDGNGVVRALWWDGDELCIFVWGMVYYRWSEAGLTEHPFYGDVVSEEDGVLYYLFDIVPGDGELSVLIGELDEDYQCHGARLCGVTFDEAGNATLDEGVELDWEPMIQPGGGSAIVYYPMTHEGAFACVLMDEDGVGTLFVYGRDRGHFDFYDTDADGYTIDVKAVCAYGEGTAIIACAGEGSIAFYAIDFESEDMEKLCEVPAVDTWSLMELAYDRETGDLYYALDEVLWRMENFDPATAEEIMEGATAIAPGDLNCALLPGGKVVMSDWYAAKLYDPVAPEPTITLSIANTAYDEAIDAAYFAFLEAHPDAGVTIENADMLGPGDIAQAILTQSTQYDIYVLDMGGRDYAALYDRGYLPPLYGADIAEYVGGTYATVQDAVQKDGAIVALPLAYYINMITVNMDALSAVGLSQADLPTDWVGFLKLLQRLPGLLEDTDYMAFEPTSNAANLKGGLFSEILDAYRLYLQSDASAGMRFDTDILRAILAEFEKVDFEGLYTDEGFENGDYDETKMLFRLGNDAGLKYFRHKDPVMQLSLAEGMAPIEEIDITGAIVNPYSPNCDAAVEYLNMAQAAIPEEVVAALSPGLDAAILWPNHDRTIANYEERIAQTEAELQAAKSDEERAEWQETLDELNANYAEYLADPWMISGEDIDVFRTYMDDARAGRYFGFSSYDAVGNDFYGQVAKYLDGAIDADTLLKTLDEKVNMMLREAQ